MLPGAIVATYCFALINSERVVMPLVSKKYSMRTFFCNRYKQYWFPSRYLEHFHHLIAQMVNHLHGETAGFWFREGARGIAVKGGPGLAGVEELDLASPPFFLAVGDDPDVGADAGIVKHLLRQGDHRFEPVVFDDPFTNVALPGPRAAGEKGRAAEDDCQARAMFLLVRQHRLEFSDHVLQKEQRTVVYSGKSGAEPSFKTELLVFPLDFRLLLFPVDAEWRIGEKVVEGVAGKLVVGKAVAEADVVAAAVVVHLFHEHVGRGGCKGPFVVVLAVNEEPGGGMMLP